MKSLYYMSYKIAWVECDHCNFNWNDVIIPLWFVPLWWCNMLACISSAEDYMFDHQLVKMNQMGNFFGEKYHIEYNYVDENRN